jgi:hypothetical protein
MTKCCSRCGEELPLDRFSLNRAHADGRQNECKGCSKKSTAESEKRHAERVRATHTRWREANRGKDRERHRRFRERHREELNERRRVGGPDFEPDPPVASDGERNGGRAAERRGPGWRSCSNEPLDPGEVERFIKAARRREREGRVDPDRGAPHRIGGSAGRLYLGGEPFPF